MLERKGRAAGVAASGAGRPRTSVGRGLRRSLQVCFVVSVLLIAGYWLGVGAAGMATVSLVRPNLVYPAADVGLWALMTCLVAAGIAACLTPTGSVPTAKWQIDFAQLAAAFCFLCLVAMMLPLVSGLEFTGPDDRCVSGGCWPRPYQELLIASPALLAIAAMSVCGIVGSKMRWWLRSGIPALTFAGASAVQLATWQTVILPFLAGRT